MPSLFSRTSTFLALDGYLQEDSIDPIIIKNYINSRGHNRRLADIKVMINHLISVGLINNQRGEQLTRLVLQADVEHPSQKDIFIANEFIFFLNNEGLAISPFLEAVGLHPNRSNWIQSATVKNGKTYGFYSLREGQDVVAAMGNFASYIGLLKPRKPGKYELTELGMQIVNQNEQIIDQRSSCDQNEPCRLICPTNAITPTKINFNNCIECGLCTFTCPNGALDLKCEKYIKLNISVCSSSKGTKNVTQPCNPRQIILDEIPMQRWIKSILNLGGLNAEIPGPGEYPDIVTKEVPSFIEVKKRPISTNNIDKFAKQVIRYQQDEIIEKTINKLDNKEFKIDPPIKFIYIAPKSNTISNFLQTIRDENPPLPTSFISFEILYKISEHIIRGRKINIKKSWKTISSFKDESLKLTV